MGSGPSQPGGGDVGEVCVKIEDWTINPDNANASFQDLIDFLSDITAQKFESEKHILTSSFSVDRANTTIVATYVSTDTDGPSALSIIYWPNGVKGSRMACTLANIVSTGITINGEIVDISDIGRTGSFNDNIRDNGRLALTFGNERLLFTNNKSGGNVININGNNGSCSSTNKQNSLKCSSSNKQNPLKYSSSNKQNSLKYSLGNKQNSLKCSSSNKQNTCKCSSSSKQNTWEYKYPWYHNHKNNYNYHNYHNNNYQ